MKWVDPILFRQLPVIEKIIQDETWLESERRGCRVLPDDPVVRENVCAVILRVGAQMRAAFAATPAPTPPAPKTQPPRAA